MVRIQAAGDVVEAQRRLRAAVGADEYVAWVDVIDEAISRIAHAEDVQTGDDAASRVAERVVRELRQEYVDVINRLEKQSAAREEALHDAVEQARRLDELYEAACADIGDLQGKMDRLRAENERLRETLQALVDEKLVCNVREGDGSYIDVSAWCRAALEKRP